MRPTPSGAMGNGTSTDQPGHVLPTTQMRVALPGNGEQSVSPTAHAFARKVYARQIPFAHTWFDAHLLPQPPQLVSSTLVSKQWSPKQWVRPVGHPYES